MPTIGDLQVGLFLALFKQHMSNGFYLVPRDKNLKSLAKMGMTFKEAKEIVARLTPGNFYSGPKPDHERKGDKLWEFMIHINPYKIYIKLSDDFRGEKARCLSFHEPEFEV